MESNVDNNNKLNVLVVDDEINIRKTLAYCLEAEGHTVATAGNFADALAEVSRRVYDLAFVDLRLGKDDGLDLIPLLLEAAPWLKIVVITAYASIENALEAIRRGATDYIPKPFEAQQIKAVVEKTARLRTLEKKVSDLQENLNRQQGPLSFESKTPAMQKTIEMARQVAESEASLMLRGESGTGKSVLARAVHNWSKRAAHPFCVISCPSLSAELLESELFGHVKGAFTGALRDNPGRIALCDKGTLFLDEIGNLPSPLQAKLLRFLQDREYERLGDSVTRRADIRVIAATNQDLEKLIVEDAFREDLYYRLNTFQIKIPPLRECSEDIEDLALSYLAFFKQINHKPIMGIDDEAVSRLRAYSWPGNLRELKNVIERAVILCQAKSIGTEYLPEQINDRQTAVPLRIGDPVPLKQIEEAHIRLVLSCSKSLQEAADMLGIDQATLWRRRKEYKI